MRTFETKDQIPSSTLLEGDMVQILCSSREGDTVPKLGRVRSPDYPTLNELVQLANGLVVEIFPSAAPNSGGDTLAGAIAIEPSQYGDGTKVKFTSPHGNPDANEAAFTVVVDGLVQTAIGSWHVYEPGYVEFFEAPPEGAVIDITLHCPDRYGLCRY